MQLTSTAFDHEGDIPREYTCDGADLPPPLAVSGVPAGTAGLALIMDDPDAPAGTWDHWIVFDIPVAAGGSETVGRSGTPGVNSWGGSDYGGPCPPGGTHRYFFTIYALDDQLGLPAGSDKETVLAAMEGHVLGQATLMGRYTRP